MTYYTQPTISHYYEIAPGDAVTIPAKTFSSQYALPAMNWQAERAPLYSTAGLTDPSNAIYISPTGNDSASGRFAGTTADPFETVGGARSYIDNTLKVATYIVCMNGNYRKKWNTTFGGTSTFVLGVKAAKNAQVWFDGSDFLTGGTWSNSGNVWTWSGSFNSACLAPDVQVFLDGIPLIKTTSTTPSVGQFYISGVSNGTLKIGSTVNPSTKVIEFTNRNAPVAANKNNNFYIGYIGFRRYSSGTAVALAGVNQKLDHVVIAYGSGNQNGLDTTKSKGLSITELVLTHNANGKSWRNDWFGGSGPNDSQAMQVDGMRVWGGNWRHDHNTAPSGSASLGGVKHWKADGFRGKNMIFGWNVSNGEWFDGSDVGNPSADNQTSAVTYWFNGGYGQTTEVGSNRRLVDVLAVGNGWMNFGNEDGTRFSGVEKSKIYAATCLDNVGAGDANYEDGREFGGSASNFRALNPPGCGDSYACERQGVVVLRTQRVGANGVTTGQKPCFYSFCQAGDKTIAVPPGESGGTGYVQTKPLSTHQMYANDPNAGTLVITKHATNVYIDTKPYGDSHIATVAAPGSNSGWTVTPGSNPSTTPFGSPGPTATANKTLAGMQALGLDTGSLLIAVAGKAIGDYFPSAGSTGGPGQPASSDSVYSWWGISNGLIPTDGRAIPTYVPPDWACDALGVSRGSTVRVGCKNAPIPVLAGTSVNVAPDVAVLLTPADGDTVSGSSVAVTANAHDPNDNHTVTAEIRADGNPIGSGFTLTYTGTADGFAGTFDSTKLSDGNHDLRVRVTDSQGLWTSSTKHTVTVNNGADTTPPTVTSVSLSDGTVVRNPVVVSASVTDTSGVQSVIGRITGPDGVTHDFTMS